MAFSHNRKLTSIGLVPEDWTVVTIGEVAEIVGGGTPSTGNPLFWNGTIQWFTPAEITAAPKYISKSLRTITPLGLKNCSARILPVGSVLLTTRATIGAASILLNEASTNQGFQSLIAKGNCLSEYLYYLIPLIRGEMEMRATGSTFAEISPKNLSSIEISIPSISEQKRIVDALSGVDDLIGTLDEAIEKKRQIKKGLMQQLLTGKTRLPGFSGKWLPKNLGKSALIKARIGWQGLTTKEYLDSGAYYLITGTDFKDGRIDWKNCHYVTRDRFEQDPYIKIQKHDVLVSKDGTIGKVAYLDDIPGPGTLNSGVFVIRSKDKQISQRYLAKVFVSKYFDDFIDSIVAGSTIVHLYQKDIVKFDFMVPPSIKEQEQVCDFLEGVDKEIICLESKRDKYASLKQGMMQELLTGKTRL